LTKNVEKPGASSDLLVG